MMNFAVVCADADEAEKVLSQVILYILLNKQRFSAKNGDGFSGKKRRWMFCETLTDLFVKSGVFFLVFKSAAQDHHPSCLL